MKVLSTVEHSLSREVIHMKAHLRSEIFSVLPFLYGHWVAGFWSSERFECIRRVYREYRSPASGLIVVHCSAVIGRSSEIQRNFQFYDQCCESCIWATNGKTRHGSDQGNQFFNRLSVSFKRVILATIFFHLWLCRLLYWKQVIWGNWRQSCVNNIHRKPIHVIIKILYHKSTLVVSEEALDSHLENNIQEFSKQSSFTVHIELHRWVSRNVSIPSFPESPTPIRCFSLAVCICGSVYKSPTPWMSQINKACWEASYVKYLNDWGVFLSLSETYPQFPLCFL